MNKKLISILTILFLPLQAITEEKHMVIVSPSYNNRECYKKHLDSVLNQKYTNYELFYLDDCSPDGTGKLVEEYITQKGFYLADYYTNSLGDLVEIYFEANAKPDYALTSYDGRHAFHPHSKLQSIQAKAKRKITLVKNKENREALVNRYHAIHSSKDSDIIVELDGDDWFANDEVLSYINKIYADPNIWLTYGQFRYYPSGKPGFCRPIPKEIIEKNKFRKYPWVFSALRTYYAWLFKLIKEEDLTYNGDSYPELRGKFYTDTSDKAAFYPMVEMARNGHIKFIPKVLYIYNTNPDKYEKEPEPRKQKRKEFNYLIRKTTPYDAIEEPPLGSS